MPLDHGAHRPIDDEDAFFQASWIVLRMSMFSSSFLGKSYPERQNVGEKFSADNEGNNRENWWDISDVY
jgi:hypothetical protein